MINLRTLYISQREHSASVNVAITFKRPVAFLFYFIFYEYSYSTVLYYSVQTFDEDGLLDCMEYDAFFINIYKLPYPQL